MGFVTVSEAARRINCSTTHVYRLLKRNYIAEYRNGRSHYIVEESLAAFEAKYCHGGNAPAISYIELVNNHPELQGKASDNL